MSSFVWTTETRATEVERNKTYRQIGACNSKKKIIIARKNSLNASHFAASFGVSLFTLVHCF